MCSILLQTTPQLSANAEKSMAALFVNMFSLPYPAQFSLAFFTNNYSPMTFSGSSPATVILCANSHTPLIASEGNLFSCLITLKSSFLLMAQTFKTKWFSYLLCFLESINPVLLFNKASPLQAHHIYL